MERDAGYVRKQRLVLAAVVAPFTSRRANVYSSRARRRRERRASTWFLWYEPLTQKVDTFIFSDWIDRQSRKIILKICAYLFACQPASLPAEAEIWQSCIQRFSRPCSPRTAEFYGLAALRSLSQTPCLRHMLKACQYCDFAILPPSSPTTPNLLCSCVWPL